LHGHFVFFSDVCKT